jgi:F0F1-type ATP synthase epsilon subunit
VTILAETAELPEDIDRDAVQETVEEIKATLTSGDFEDDIERKELEADLDRAEARLEVVTSDT